MFIPLCIIDRVIEAGEEILHSYGDLSGAALLRIYGFVPEEDTSNRHDFFVVTYPLIRTSAEAVIKKCTQKV